MKFEIGDQEDRKLCTVITHEFLRAESSFSAFIHFTSKWGNIPQGGNEEKQKALAIAIYNSYVDFISHLYEFYQACFKRDRGNTDNIYYKDMEKLILRETNKYRRIILNLIDSGKREYYGLNDKSYYEEDIPVEFAKKLRTVRNISFHADSKRVESGIVSEFYTKYHKFAIYLFNFSREWWTVKNYNDINWRDIEGFISVVMNKTKV